MNDAQLKREIEQALSVGPSPQFASRVRARAAAAPGPSAVWIRWSAAGVGVALAALVMGVVIHQPKEAQTPASVNLVQAAAPPQQEAPPIPQQPAVVQHVATALPPKITEPDVLIDPRSIAAFQKFVEGVRKDRIDVSTLIRDQEDQAQTINEIALMPLDALVPLMIEPLASESRRHEGGNL